MSELDKLRMELRTDLELMSIRQGGIGRRLDSIGQTVDEHGRLIAEQGQQIAEQGQQIAEQGRQIARQGEQIYQHALLIQKGFAEVAQLSRGAAEDSRWIQGRMRLMSERFDNVLGVVAGQRQEDRALLQQLQTQQANLDARLTRLEQDHPPAA